MPPFGLLHLIFFGVIIRRMMLSTEIREKSNYYDFPTSNKIAIFSVLSLPTTETRIHQTPRFPTGTTPFKHDLLSSIRVHDLVKWISNVTVQKHFIPCRPFDPDSTSSSFIIHFTLSLSSPLLLFFWLPQNWLSMSLFLPSLVSLEGSSSAFPHSDAIKCYEIFTIWFSTFQMNVWNIDEGFKCPRISTGTSTTTTRT